MRSQTSGLQIPHFDALTTEPQRLHNELILVFSQNLLITFSCNDCYGKLYGLLLFSSRIFFFIEFTDLFTFLFQEKDAKHIPLQVINNALRKGTDSHGMIYDGHRSINDSTLPFNF